MNYQFIVSERENNIATIRLNRPEKLNSWNLQMRQEMRDVVHEMVEDDDLRVLIITGTGRAFSAGEDVHGMGDLSSNGPKSFRRRVRMIHNVFDELEKIEVPVIAAINGVAAGGGLELALSCDFRIAADSAKMGLPEGNVGLIPGSGGISRLVKLVGPAVAKRLVMTGEIIPATKALDHGLVEEVVETGKSFTKGIELAEQVCNQSPLSVSACKELIHSARSQQNSYESELKPFVELFDTKDQKEGVSAFLEKRPPKWRNA